MDSKTKRKLYTLGNNIPILEASAIALGADATEVYQESIALKKELR